MRQDDRRYRLLLRLLPRAFREERERELLRVWREEAADALPHRRSRVWRAALVDTLRTAPAVHAAAWGSDFRQAWRGLRKTPMFAATAVLTLALGTGATGGVFSLLDAVILQPLPWRAADRVGLVWAVPPQGARTWLSFPEVADIAHNVRSLEAVVGMTDVRFALTTGGSADEVQALAVSHALLSTLGITLAAGRDFVADDDREGAAPVAILGHDLWRSRFGGSRAIVGQSIELDGSAYEVIGVLPADFELLPASSVLPDRPDLLVALERHLASRDRSVRFLHALARLQDGATFARANAELNAFARRLPGEVSHADESHGWSFSISSFQQDVLAGVRTPLVVTFGLVLLVLLMACANVANLLLGRGETRRADLAVRAALGAGPGRLAGELLAESLILAAAGCTLGAVLAALLPIAVRVVNPAAMPRLDRLAIDWRMVAFMASLVLATAVLFTLVPMIERLRTRAALTGVATRSGGRSARSARASALLVAVQTMLATMVVVTTVFLVNTVAELQRVDLGFDPRGAMTARVTRPPQADPAATPAFFEQVTAAAAHGPGVSAAGAITQLPLSGAMLGSTFLVDPGNEERRIDADLRGVTPGYFQAIGVRLIAGRLFDANDRASTEPVAIVDRTFARSLQANGQVLGRSIRWIRQPAADVQIVGIVDGVRHRSVSDAPRETVYRPHTQYSRPSMYMVVRGGGDERALRQTLAAAVAAVDPRQPLADVATLKERVSRATARARTTLLLAAILAALGLLLAGVGLYGVLSFAVSQRLREFGVRLSMGATPMTLAVGVAREGLALAGAGVAIGSLGAAALLRAASAVLYGTSIADVRLYALAAAVVLACSAVAFVLPARRAAAADPSAILRSE